MSKEKELVKNTAIITFGKVCTQLVSFLLLPLYTSVLNTEEYGTVDLVITYSTLLLPFITLALEQALFRFLIDVRKDEEKTAHYISTTVIISSALLLIAVSIIFGIYCFTSNRLFLLFALVLIGSTVSAVALQICRGLGDNLGYAIGSAISAIVHVIFNVLLIVLVPLGPYGMMIATFIGNACCGLYVFIRCRLWNKIKLSYFDKNDFNQLSKYSLPLIPNQLSWWALNASDKVIVQFFIGVAGNGLVAVATKFSSIYIQFNSIFNISWTESAALHINDEDADTFFSETITAVYKLFLCTCCGIIVIMPFLFPIMVNKQYNEAYGLIPIFMLASLFNVIVSLYGVIYVAYKKTVEIAKTAIYAALLNVFSHLALVRFIGVYAAAISTAIGYGGMAVYRYFHSRRYLTVKLPREALTWSVILIGVSLISYYCGNITQQMLSFVFVAITSFFLNKKMLTEIIVMIKTKIQKT